jgi:hypothetical protein
MIGRDERKDARSASSDRLDDGWCKKIMEHLFTAVRKVLWPSYGGQELPKK